MAVGGVVDVLHDRSQRVQSEQHARLEEEASIDILSLLTVMLPLEQAVGASNRGVLALAAGGLFALNRFVARYAARCCPAPPPRGPVCVTIQGDCE